jgi:hypothetical protein
MTNRWQTLRDVVRTGRLIAAYPTATTIGSGELPPLAADIGLRRDATLVVPANGQVVFRLLGRSAAREWDFQSARDRGRGMGPRQDFLDYLGVSVFGTEEAALAIAARIPKLVARVHLPAGEHFMIARTLPEYEHHYSVWGSAKALARRVVGITRINDLEQG